MADKINEMLVGGNSSRGLIHVTHGMVDLTGLDAFSQSCLDSEAYMKRILEIYNSNNLVLAAELEFQVTNPAKEKGLPMRRVLGVQ